MKQFAAVECNRGKSRQLTRNQIKHEERKNNFYDSDNNHRLI